MGKAFAFDFFVVFGIDSFSVQMLPLRTAANSLPVRSKVTFLVSF